jgi:hypothetical protein
MTAIKGRKLRFGEILLLGDVFKCLGVKEHVEYLQRQNKKKRSNKTPKDFKEGLNSESNNTQEDFKDVLRSESNEIALDIILYLIENINRAREPIFILLSSYMELPLKDDNDEYTVENLDGDCVFDAFNLMFKNGLPDIISKMLKQNGASFLVKSNVQKS